jgi:hypothetical protein
LQRLRLGLAEKTTVLRQARGPKQTRDRWEARMRVSARQQPVQQYAI